MNLNVYWYLRNMTEEFMSCKIIDRENVTCEFSTTSEHLGDTFFIYLEQLNRNLQFLGYEWRIYFCPTCYGYHTNRPLHVEIVNTTNATAA